MRAYELYLEQLLADRVFHRLREEGFSAHLAARAITFLPSAFARVYYRKEGFTFPECFYPGFAAYQAGRKLRYVEEPVFQSAMQLAEQLVRDGDWTQVWRFIEISAEHSGIMKARTQGLTPTSFEAFIHEF